MILERGPLLADDSLKGSAWCRAHSDLIDAWVLDLFNKATVLNSNGFALLAVGGYGRSELCPSSDLDIILIHDGQPDVSATADRIWYPIWDQGLTLSHSVFTVKEILALGADDLETATALLSARHVAGTGSLSEQIIEGANSQWRKKSKNWLSLLAGQTEVRHQKFGEVAFRLEPDLKEGRGGIRDVHALGWAEAANQILLDHDHATLAQAYSVILDARVELQRQTSRPGNILALQEQKAVAEALGDPDAESLMARIAEAGRLISWTSDDTWRRIRTSLRGPLERINERTRQLGPGLVLEAGEVRIEQKGKIDDSSMVLRAALAAASQNTAIERHSLERLAAEAPDLPEPWSPKDRRVFVDLLLTGAPAISVIEALDQRGLWTRILPEWQPVRAKPQHNAYHLFTVDRHLLETVTRAAFLADRVRRPDLLVVAALLHDLGKGYPGNHSLVGAELAKTIGARMGFSSSDVAVLSSSIQHHLLLPEVATRRDLDDPATLRRVASVIGNLDLLHFLAALTEADSIATGSSAWSPFKASLVRELVYGVAHVLEGTEPSRSAGAAFPTKDQLELLSRPGRHIEVQGEVLTVMTDDRPGTFSRIAGVLALHGLDVLSASAYSSEEGRALAEFRVLDQVREQTPWPKIVSDLELALDRRIALEPRLAERVRTYGRPKQSSRSPVIASVSFHTDASEKSDVIEVRAPDGIGVLYRVTKALADLDLNIRSAKVQTQGAKVIDTFYVQDRAGAKLTDKGVFREIELAILHALSENV